MKVEFVSDVMPESAPLANSSSLDTPAASPVAGAVAVARPVRVLAARPSRERSPRRGDGSAKAILPASEPSVGSFGPARFIDGQAVIIGALVTRPDLTEKRATVKSFDASCGRYVLLVADSDEQVRVKEENLRASLFGVPSIHDMKKA